jgi:hypothetical protein
MKPKYWFVVVGGLRYRMARLFGLNFGLWFVGVIHRQTSTDAVPYSPAEGLTRPGTDRAEELSPSTTEAGD